MASKSSDEAQKVMKHLDKKYIWSLYLLIDIKVLYILLYLYTSAINLISSTANIEATEDSMSTLEFPITSTNTGNVTEISDTVLWNCREHSLTAPYYRTLYRLLLYGLSSAMVIFVVIKVLALLYADFVCSQGLKRMWHIAKPPNKATWQIFEQAEKMPDSVSENFKCSCWNFCRILIPVIVLLLGAGGLMFSFLTYDLHLLACIQGIPETSIQYYSEGTEMGRVDIDISDELLHLQLIAPIVIAAVLALILFLALAFYCFTKCIIQDIKHYKVNTNNTR